MHTLHWIAIRATSTQQAADFVRDALEEYQSPWYDWYVVGGGRWNVSDNDSFTEAYVDNKLNMIISKQSSPEEFTAKLESCTANKMEEFKRDKTDWLAKNISLMDLLNSYDGESRLDLDIWRLYRMLETMTGAWTPDTYYYDAHNGGSNTNWCKNSTDNDWYLVPVDFHF